MGINIGYKTRKLYFGHSLRVSNDADEMGFDAQGRWNIGYTVEVPSSRLIREDDYLDLGILTDEREELALGSIAIPVPGAGAQHRISWSVAGRVLRLTLSGIIPDGLYVSQYSNGNIIDSSLHGRSNASVFRYKVNKYLAYTNVLDSGNNVPIKIGPFSLDVAGLPAVVQFRRTYLQENTGNNKTNLSRFIITSYSVDFIQGTRNLRYTLTLEMGNNTGLNLQDGIKAKNIGEI
jgi:hypothetical protein